LKGNPDTRIEVCYLTPKRLIFIHIFNPATPGKNRQQVLKNLCNYEFGSQKETGQPGLDFSEINIKGISNYLKQGFNGNETIYYRKGSPAKSRLTTSSYPGSPQHTITYHFHEQPFLEKLQPFLEKFLNIVIGREIEYDEVQTIDLQNVFSGLNHHTDT